MSSITFTGLASGMDTATIVSKLVDLERLPEKTMQQTQSTYQSQINAYTSLQSALTDLQNSADTLGSASTAKAMTVSVTDSSIATATASSSATAGTHTLTVNTLARNQRQVSIGYADGTTFGTGSFTIDDGNGNVTTVNVDGSNNTLSGIAALINSSGANVNASIINDGSATPNRLVITGKDTKNYTVDFSGLGTGPSLLGPGDPSYQAGVDASFTLDGVNITKSSNTVTDALTGVTINLLKEGGSTTTFTVGNDTSTVTSKINDFVSKYNAAIKLINDQSKYDSTKNTAGVLSGDTTLRNIQFQLQSLLTTTVTGVSGSYSSLAALGFTTDKTDGTLSVDSTKLSTALASNFNDVIDLFTHNTDSLASHATNEYGIAQQFNLAITNMVATATNNGPIQTRITGLQKSISDIDDQISDMELRITAYQSNLESQFANMEQVVSNLKNQGSYLLSALSTSSSSSSSK